jgi:hypothetical protein
MKELYEESKRVCRNILKSKYKGEIKDDYDLETIAHDSCSRAITALLSSKQEIKFWVTYLMKACISTCTEYFEEKNKSKLHISLSEYHQESHDGIVDDSFFLEKDYVKDEILSKLIAREEIIIIANRLSKRVSKDKNFLIRLAMLSLEDNMDKKIIEGVLKGKVLDRYKIHRFLLKKILVKVYGIEEIYK